VPARAAAAAAPVVPLAALCSDGPPLPLFPAVRTAKFVPRKQWIVVGADDMMVRVYNYNTMDKVGRWAWLGSGGHRPRIGNRALGWTCRPRAAGGGLLVVAAAMAAMWLEAGPAGSRSGRLSRARRHRRPRRCHRSTKKECAVAAVVSVVGSRGSCRRRV
jgi:hypothetical protein